MTGALVSKTCAPCRGGVAPLTREQAELFHEQASDWQLPEEAHHIERSFRFRNFREALTFVQQIGALAEAEGHHPNICFSWGKRPSDPPPEGQLTAVLRTRYACSESALRERYINCRLRQNLFGRERPELHASVNSQ
jgi:Pterin 4 alpha carbinolamine dehydratase